MDWELEFTFASRTLIALLLGGFLGWERKHERPAAGIRTFAAVCVGSCVFGLLSQFATDTADRTRIAAQVVSGIGFLGAGAIIRNQGRVAGLATAATLWSAAAVGLAVAYGKFVIAVFTTLLLYALLELHHFGRWSSVKNIGAPSEDEDPGFESEGEQDKTPRQTKRG
jgi:putative Mg2+ transporter-C (MgtC) family protein